MKFGAFLVAVAFWWRSQKLQISMTLGAFWWLSQKLKISMKFEAFWRRLQKLQISMKFGKFELLGGSFLAVRKQARKAQPKSNLGNSATAFCGLMDKDSAFAREGRGVNSLSCLRGIFL